MKAYRFKRNGKLYPNLHKDQRVSGCGICGKYIYSNQEYTWTSYIGFVHNDECLAEVKKYERRTKSA